MPAVLPEFIAEREDSLVSIQRVDGAEHMLWASGTYVEEYRRVEGEWLFSRIHASGRWMRSFDEGFVSDPTGLG